VGKEIELDSSFSGDQTDQTVGKQNYQIAHAHVKMFPFHSRSCSQTEKRKSPLHILFYKMSLKIKLSINIKGDELMRKFMTSMYFI